MIPSVPSYISKSLENVRDETNVRVKTVKINPFGAQEFSASGTRNPQWKLPRDGHLVGQESYLYIQVKPDGDSASDDKIMEDIHTIFDRLRILIGTQEIVNEEEYGWFKNLEFNAYASSTDIVSSSSTVMNIPDSSTSGAFKKYRIPLSSIFNKHGFFKDIQPLWKLDQVTLEWQINNTLAEFTTASTAVTSLDIVNCQLELYIVDSPVIRKLFDRDLVRSFKTHYHYHATLPSGATRLDVSIPSSFQNLRGIAMIMRNSVDVTDPDWETGTAIATQKYSHSFQLNNLKNFSVKIDGKPYPEEPIDGTNGVELVSNLERFWNVDNLGAWFDNDTLVNADSKGYYALSFDASDEGVSGMSMTSKSGTIVVNATFSSALSANTDVDFFLVYDKFYVIKKDGAFSVRQ
jgi:hypothetical protein